MKKLRRYYHIKHRSKLGIYVSVCPNMKYLAKKINERFALSFGKGIIQITIIEK